MKLAGTGLSFGSFSVQASDRTDSSLGASILARVFMQKKESSLRVSYCPPALIDVREEAIFQNFGQRSEGRIEQTLHWGWARDCTQGYLDTVLKFRLISVHDKYLGDKFEPLPR